MEVEHAWNWNSYGSDCLHKFEFVNGALGITMSGTDFVVHRVLMEYSDGNVLHAETEIALAIHKPSQLHSLLNQIPNQGSGRVALQLTIIPGPLTCHNSIYLFIGFAGALLKAVRVLVN